MECFTKIDEDLFYVGYSDRRIDLFENVYPVPEGVSYNSYLLMDEKNVLFDTVDKSIYDVFFDNLKFLLAGKKLDYVIVNHVEPDHSATLKTVLEMFPDARVICTSSAKQMIENFFTISLDGRVDVIENVPELSTGKHKLKFVKAPMVHWPEVMVTYDETTGTLFSADAFGSFGAVVGSIYADSVTLDEKELEYYRRYYTNIVGKYGAQVQNALKALSTLKINRICPLHGKIWRKDIDKLLSLYSKWSNFEPEQIGVVILYASIYGGTERACNLLANEIAGLTDKPVEMYDVSKTDGSYLLSHIMKYSHVVFASSTYNTGIFIKMEDLLSDVVAHNFQNRVVAFIENGSWAPAATNLMKKKLEPLKNMKYINAELTIKSTVKPEQLEQIKTLAKEISESLI